MVFVVLICTCVWVLRGISVKCKVPISAMVYIIRTNIYHYSVTNSGKFKINETKDCSIIFLLQGIVVKFNLINLNCEKNK